MIKDGVKYLYETLEAEGEGVTASLLRDGQEKTFFAMRKSFNVDTESIRAGSDIEYEMVISAELDQFEGAPPQNGELIQIPDIDTFSVEHHSLKPYSIILYLGKHYE